MELPEGYEVIESVAVWMDPALDGFAGVLVEIIFDGERYVLAETALGSGSRLLRFRSGDPEADLLAFRVGAFGSWRRKPCRVRREGAYAASFVVIVRRWRLKSSHNATF